MARFSQALLSSLASPTFGRELGAIGQNIGAAPGMFTQGLKTARAEEQQKQQQSQAMQIVNEAIASNDPQKLLQAAQMVSQFDPATAMRLAGMAQQSTSAKSAGSSSKGLQGGLMAIRNAAAKGTPLEQLTEASKSVISLGGTQEQIQKAYDSGASKKDSEGLTFKVESEVDPETNVTRNIRYGFDKEGKMVSKTPLGISKMPEGETTANIYGLTPESTKEDYEAAQLKALNKGDSVDATRLSEIMKERFPEPVTIVDAVNIAKLVNPGFEKDLEMKQIAPNIRAVADAGGAGSQALVESILKSGFPNDVKAVQELERFRQSKGLLRRFQDGMSKLATGNYTDITNQEYQAIADAMEELASKRMHDTYLKMVAGGEEDAADRFYDVYIPDTAKIVGSTNG